MKTKTILNIAAVAIIIVGGGYLIFQDRETVKDTAKPENTATQKEVKTDGKKMAFEQFIKQGDGSYKCTVHQWVQDTDTVGTVYISKDKVKGEFNTKVQGMNVDTSFIARDGYTYTWSSMMPSMGFKAPIQQTEAQGDVSTSGSYSFNMQTIGDYDCVKQDVSDSMFVLPSITFTEIKK